MGSYASATTAKNSLPINGLSVTTTKGTYVYLTLVDNGVLTQTMDVRFYLTEAFNQFKAAYMSGQYANANAGYQYLNDTSVADLRFDFGNKKVDILRLTAAYQPYVDTPTFTVLPDGQN